MIGIKNAKIDSCYDRNGNEHQQGEDQGIPVTEGMPASLSLLFVQAIALLYGYIFAGSN